MDINFELGSSVFNYRVASIIKNGNKILVSKNDDKKYLSLIGGRAKTGESSIEAVLREVYEETSFKAKHVKSLGMIENFYISRYSDKPYHEILIIHELEFIDKSVYERDEITNLEDGGTFIWKSIEELKKENFKPSVVLANIGSPNFFHIINKD